MNRGVCKCAKANLAAEAYLAVKAYPGVEAYPAREAYLAAEAYPAYPSHYLLCACVISPGYALFVQKL